MVAYSFRRRFVEPIKVGLGLERHVHIMEPLPAPKQQTIRADRRRHARPGEEIQLYCGMRTKQCFLIGKARCISIEPITIRLFDQLIWIGADARAIIQGQKLDKFARADGFADWADMREFWRQEHPLVLGAAFAGVVIRWEPLSILTRKA